MLCHTGHTGVIPVDHGFARCARVRRRVAQRQATLPGSSHRLAPTSARTEKHFATGAARRNSCNAYNIMAELDHQLLVHFVQCDYTSDYIILHFHTALLAPWPMLRSELLHHKWFQEDEWEAINPLKRHRTLSTSNWT